LLVLLMSLSVNAFAQCPPNIGFENGSFEGWVCSIGSIDPAGNISVSGALNAPFTNRQTLISTAGSVDKYGHFPTLCPNGSKYSVRLGNDINGKQAEQLSYTFKVPPGKDYSLVFYCAVVLQNPAHAAYQQPKFTAHVFNVTDSKYIDCPSFDFIASYNIPGFKLSDVIPDADSTTRNATPANVYYKDWTATTINLAGYAGKTVRLEFTTNDCTLGGHFGYAYIDINEECTQAITGNTYCAGQNSITLRAPAGFDNYTWFGSDITHSVGSGQTLTLSPPPPDQSKYGVLITPYPGLGCPDTIYTVVNRIDAKFTLKVADTVWGCQGAGADLTAASVTEGSTPGMTFTYFTNPETLLHIANPRGVNEPGIYYIKGTSPEGCTNILPVQVLLHEQPIITITDPLPLQYPQTIDLSTVFVPKSGQTYSYYSDSKATIPLANYRNIGTNGKYYIKAVNGYGCTTLTYTIVKVVPPPPYVISAPNVFTPNNDGINDYFSIKIDGFVSFGNVKIFNRYGQLLFTAKSTYDLWDGNYNGHPLPAGTYYWVFEGTDQYYRNKVKKAASISIAR
jgi:gliding motility-associated-like protein